MVLPSQTAALSCVQQGRIDNLLVKEGDTVDQGALLVQIDDGFQRARTEIARVDAESTLGVELAKARWEHADRNWTRLKSLHGGDFASSKELSDAFADAETLRLEFELAQMAHEQAARSYQREKELLAQLQVRAPFRGYIAKLQRHPGEIVDVGEPILQIARLDELQVIATCPLNLAKRIATGSSVRVRPVDPGWDPRIGTVRFASRVADAASQTFELRVTVDNTDGGWLSGFKVTVDLSEEPQADARGDGLRGPTTLATPK